MSANPTPLLSFEVRGRLTVGTVRTSKVLDASNLKQFGQELLDHVTEEADLHLLLNFEKVDFMSSAVLSELLLVNEQLRTNKGSLRLCNLCEAIHDVFRITNLEGIFAIHEDDEMETAVKRYERSLAPAGKEEAGAGSDRRA